MVTVDEIYNRLRLVDDPELGINLVDLGLIYGVEVDGHSVRITMTLTTQGCPMHAALAPAVEAAVLGLLEVTSVDVEVVWDPAWTPDRMSSQAALALGWQR
jgi:metal-sulfur cluster biosynthetic enzyme